MHILAVLFAFLCLFNPMGASLLLEDIPSTCILNLDLGPTPGWKITCLMPDGKNLESSIGRSGIWVSDYYWKDQDEVIKAYTRYTDNLWTVVDTDVNWLGSVRLSGWLDSYIEIFSTNSNFLVLARLHALDISYTLYDSRDKEHVIATLHCNFLLRNRWTLNILDPQAFIERQIDFRVVLFAIAHRAWLDWSGN